MTPFSLHGIGVSNGIAIGKAHLISNALLEVVQYDIDKKNIHHEIKRFEDAIAAVRIDLNKIKSQLPSDSPG
ncbi:MAG TPA: phosphoenolpyruvate--protein phosphotransferase, partial [Methylophilaceae bacterium]|nr:phosphoenolpyruvate--protein phosphotransferase [Methylophilaceae bacterium]